MKNGDWTRGEFDRKLPSVILRAPQFLILAMIAMHTVSCVPLLVAGAVGVGYVAHEQGIGVVEPIYEKEARERREREAVPQYEQPLGYDDSSFDDDEAVY